MVRLNAMKNYLPSHTYTSHLDEVALKYITHCGLHILRGDGGDKQKRKWMH